MQPVHDLPSTIGPRTCEFGKPAGHASWPGCVTQAANGGVGGATQPAGQAFAAGAHTRASPEDWTAGNDATLLVAEHAPEVGGTEVARLIVPAGREMLRVRHAPVAS